MTKTEELIARQELKMLVDKFQDDEHAACAISISARSFLQFFKPACATL